MLSSRRKRGKRGGISNAEQIRFCSSFKRGMSEPVWNRRPTTGCSLLTPERSRIYLTSARLLFIRAEVLRFPAWPFFARNVAAQSLGAHMRRNRFFKQGRSIAEWRAQEKLAAQFGSVNQIKNGYFQIAD